MKVKVATSTRLELAHRTMAVMLLVAFLAIGFAVRMYLSEPSWKGYVGIGILGLVGLPVGFFACNSYVIFDKAAGYSQMIHRYLFGKSSRKIPLEHISAVVINRDSFPTGVLSVICVRVNASDLPITMFGSPFGGSVHHHALRISRFLNVPLRDRERLDVPDLEGVAQDLLGAVASKVMFDPIEQTLAEVRSERKSERIEVRCPECMQSEHVSRARLLDGAGYRKFSVEADPGSGSLHIICRKCNTSLVVTPTQVREVLS